MVRLTNNEKKILLILFKDFSNYLNANSISKKVGISRIGSMKILKKLEKEELLLKKQIGKSIVYRLNLQKDYTKHLIVFLLSDEANNFKRWLNEFKELFAEERIVMLYGSTIRDYSKARDIDIMIIREKGDSEEIHRIIKERQKILPKKIHLIDLTPKEFLKNIEQKQSAIIDIIKNAIILYGQNKYVELIKDVTSF